MPRKTNADKLARTNLKERIDREIRRIEQIGEDWFGFRTGEAEYRGSFKGMTTRDTYTKAAHFLLLKEMLPAGSIVLTTEQEATLASVLPHIFEDEICQNRFTWLAMKFNKKAKKPEIVGKVKAYRKDWRRFHNDGMYNGTFDPETDAETVTRAFIAERMTVATRGEKKPAPYPISNFHSRAIPKIWMRAPTQASGELDKVVGFPIVPRPLRQQLKELSFDEKDLDPEIREELAGLIYKATLQASSTFMNSLRERVSSASRAGSGGARVGGSYIQGAIFNPKTLISLLNIYRVHYNFFEPRPYSSPFEEPAAATRKPVLAPRSLRIPGTNEHVELPPRTRRKPKRSTPAMRHGIDTLVRRKTGAAGVPDLYRVIYRPWLYAGTKAGAKLDRTWRAPSETTTPPTTARFLAEAETETQS